LEKERMQEERNKRRRKEIVIIQNLRPIKRIMETCFSCHQPTQSGREKENNDLVSYQLIMMI